MDPVMCLVTDRRRFGAAWEEALVDRVRAAAEAGVQLLQIRERDLDACDLLRIVTRCVDGVRGTRARVLVNDRLDVALAAGAHGVHLPANGLPAARMRKAVPAGFLIGRSVHDLDEAVWAAGEGGLDYLLFGTVFPSQSKPGVEAAGLTRLSATAHAVPLPVLAIGGVTLDRVRAVAVSGAAGFAAIGLFASADAQSLCQEVQQAWAAFDTLQSDSPLPATRGKPDRGDRQP